MEMEIKLIHVLAAVVTAIILGVVVYFLVSQGQTEGLTGSAPTVRVLAASSWCGWSVKQVKEIPAITTALEKQGISVELIEDDTPKMKELAKQHGIGGFPATLVVGADGEVKGKINGYKPAAAMVEAVHKIIV